MSFDPWPVLPSVDLLVVVVVTVVVSSEIVMLAVVVFASASEILFLLDLGDSVELWTCWLSSETCPWQ